MKTPVIDLDANATTRIDPRVLTAIVDASGTNWGNPSSDNALGRAARNVVENSRTQVSELIDAQPSEILFTSGATESINLAIQGIVRASGKRPAHVITSRVEHKAVVETIEQLQEAGEVEPTYLSTDRYGCMNPNAISGALRTETVLVCVIHGNNEIGSINPIREIGQLLHDHPAAYFVDAAQTLGYFPVSVRENGIDAMCLSSHKMHGPKGIGGLFCRSGLKLAPIMFGGGQERGFRPGTLNVPGIAGFGVASQLASRESSERVARVKRLASILLDRLRAAEPNITVNGHPTLRLPGLLSVTIPYVEYYELKRRLPNIAFSHGSACTDGSEPSHVLMAIGLTPRELNCTFRVGLSSMTTGDDVVTAAEQFYKAIRRLRGRPA